MKALLLLLLVGKLGKLALSMGSMLISLVTYSFVYGWRYATGFIAMLFVHELGHFLAARRLGMNVGLPTFIPFVGAWIELKDQPLHAENEAFVGIAGPMLGSAAAFMTYLVAQQTGERLFFAIAYAGFMLNLFNLIPLSPLDGGRIMTAISPKLWLAGIPLLVGLYLWHPSPMIILIGILAVPPLWKFFKDGEVQRSTYYQVDGSVRMRYAFQYLMLVCALSLLSFETHQRLGLAAH